MSPSKKFVIRLRGCLSYHHVAEDPHLKQMSPAKEFVIRLRLCKRVLVIPPCGRRTLNTVTDVYLASLREVISVSVRQKRIQCICQCRFLTSASVWQKLIQYICQRPFDWCVNVSGQGQPAQAGPGGLAAGPAVLCWCQRGWVLDEGEGTHCRKHRLRQGRGLGWGQIQGAWAAGVVLDWGWFRWVQDGMVFSAWELGKACVCAPFVLWSL